MADTKKPVVRVSHPGAPGFEEFSPVPANSWIEFERDVVAGWRASERGVMAVKDPRQVQKNTA
jgi:SRSO17 transposase